MDVTTLGFDVKVIRAKNIDFNVRGDLFVRCYLPAGNNKRVQINTKQVSSKPNLLWDETFSLECLGSQEAINTLSQANVVLELRSWRRRRSAPFLGIICGWSSKLLGRAEIPCKLVLDSENMEIETWVSMIPRKSSSWNDDLKPPKVQINMKIKMPEKRTNMAAKTNRLMKRWDECGCKDGGCRRSCVDYDFYAIGFALDGFVQ